MSSSYNFRYSTLSKRHYRDDWQIDHKSKKFCSITKHGVTFQFSYQDNRLTCDMIMKAVPVHIKNGDIEVITIDNDYIITKHDTIDFGYEKSNQN